MNDDKFLSEGQDIDSQLNDLLREDIKNEDTTYTFNSDSLSESEKSIVSEERVESKEKGKNYIALSFAVAGVAAVIIFALFFVTNRFVEAKSTAVIGAVYTDGSSCVLDGKK